MDGIKSRIDKLAAAQYKVNACSSLLANLQRLQLQLEYMQMDVQLQFDRLSGVPKAERCRKVDDLLQFVETNADRGIFISRNRRFVPETIYKSYECL